MIAGRRIVLLALLVALVDVAACRPAAVEPGIAPEIFITPGPTETILLSNEEILQNNCDGGAAMSQTVERSYTVSRILELGAAITVDAGGRAGIPGVGEVGVGAAVASHYNVSYGEEETVARGVTVAAEKGQNILHTVRQNMIWETGTLVIAGATEPIPYRFRKDFSMETLPPANLGCPGQGGPVTDSGAVAQTQPAAPPEPTRPTDTPQPLLPTNTPQPPPPTDTPEPPPPSPVTLSIWSTNENGEVFRAERAGQYEVRYLGDAYSAWPSAEAEGYRGWTTILRYYVNRPVEWGTTDFGLQGPINEDGYLTPGNYYLNKTDAIASAGSDNRRLVSLNAGGYITFIALDEQGRYFDNQGKVDVQIVYLGE